MSWQGLSTPQIPPHYLSLPMPCAWHIREGLCQEVNILRQAGSSLSPSGKLLPWGKHSANISHHRSPKTAQTLPAQLPGCSPEPLHHTDSSLGRKSHLSPAKSAHWLEMSYVILGEMSPWANQTNPSGSGNSGGLED